jgi:Transposase family tnp2
MNPSIMVSCVISAVMTELFSSPRRAGRIVLAGCRSLLQSTSTPQHIIDQVPKDPRTASSRLRLDPVIETYISCSECFSLSPLSPSGQDPPEITHCAQRRKPGNENLCGAQLWEKHLVGGQYIWTPCRKYLHQVLKHWLGRLLSRKGIEDIIDEYPMQATSGSSVDDIWSSPRFKELTDCDGKPFLQGLPHEGRYVFSLAVDGFNPLQMKEAKQTASSTGIFITLLNFPPHLRHVYHNMLLAGIISGPFSPSNEEINHALELVVDDFQELWSPGVYFSHTYKYPLGRAGKGMLVPLVSDMLAVRQAAGFTSVTSHLFCVSCALPMSHIEDFNQSNWPGRDMASDLKHAEEWKAATSERDRIKLEKTHGVRYSPLQRLKYWKPSVYCMVEAMHTLDLVMIRHHIRFLFGINLDKIGGDASDSRMARPDRPSDSSLDEVMEIFKSGRNNPNLLEDILALKDRDKRVKVSFSALWHICKDLGLRRAGDSKKRVWLARTIIEWVCSLNNINDNCSYNCITPL